MNALRSRGAPRTSARVRAALAAGLALGIPAGLTVAAWTDAEFTAPATFTASRFDVETSLQGGAYSGSTTVPTSVSGLYPSSTLTSGRRYISLAVRTTTSSVAGTVRVSAAAATGALAPALRYRIVALGAAATCDAGAFGVGATYLAGDAAAFHAASSALPLTAPVAIGAAGSTPAQLCVELSVADGAAQGTYAGTAATVTWSLTARSAA